MVVAAGAADGEPEEGRAGGAHDVVEFVGALVGGEDRIGRLHLVPRAADEEAGGHVVAEGVAGELRADEGVVGHVGVDGVDHPVAVAPGVGARLVHLEAVALGEADDVEPVAGEALAEAAGGEEPIDEAAEGGVAAAGGDVGGEGGDLLGRRWQADQIERRPADERGRIGLLLHREPLGGESRGQEAVDRMGFVAGGGRRPHDRLEGPVDGLGRRREQLRRQRRQIVGPGGAGGDPGPQGVDLLRRERFAVGGHPRVGIGARDAGEHRAGGRIAGHHARGARVASGERPVAEVDAVPALGPVGPVARAAATGEERRDRGGEVGGGFGGRGDRRCQDADGRGEESEAVHGTSPGGGDRSTRPHPMIPPPRPPAPGPDRLGSGPARPGISRGGARGRAARGPRSRGRRPSARRCSPGRCAPSPPACGTPPCSWPGGPWPTRPSACAAP